MSEQKSSIADPGPLGLAGFGITTLLLSLINAGILSAHAMGAVLPLALAYGGLCQLLAGMWEFKKGNTFGATAFTSYGAFWISFYLLVGNLSSMGKDAGTAVGVYLLLWGVFTLYMFFGSFFTNKALFFVFLFLALTFFFLGFENMGGSSTSVGGYLGLITGVLALYTSFAGIMNNTANRTILPVGTPFAKPTK
nr:acetate uptake transporter [Bacilli bacterium]